jgi:hypothetical protein
MYALLIENTGKYKKGEILKEFKSSKKGIMKEKSFISYNNVILLNENLTKKDEDQIKKIIKEFLKLVFWRLYSRNSFVLQ